MPSKNIKTNFGSRNMTKIKINNININYELNGTGYPIVFIHGLSDDLNYWNPLVKELEKNYKTIAVDLRGHGKSDQGSETSKISLYRDDLYYLLKELKIKKAIFVGLSMGGNVALDFAVKYPKMVSGLFIMSSYSEFNHKLNHIFSKFEKAIEINFEEFYDAIIPYCLPEDTIERNKDILEEIKITKAKTANCHGISNGLKAGHGFFITNELKKIDVPTMVLGGADDDLVSPNMQRKISDNIKNSEFILFENTKHNILIGKNIAKILELIKEMAEQINSK